MSQDIIGNFFLIPFIPFILANSFFKEELARMKGMNRIKENEKRFIQARGVA